MDNADAGEYFSSFDNDTGYRRSIGYQAEYAAEYHESDTDFGFAFPPGAFGNFGFGFSRHDVLFRFIICAQTFDVTIQSCANSVF